MNALYDSIDRLTLLIDAVPDTFEAVSDQDLRLQPWLGMLSKKQKLGYLVDCATLAHQRIVRIQYEKDPAIFYNRKQWSRLQNYNEMEANFLIQLWKCYNKHLLHVIKNIPPGNLERAISLRSGDEYSLELLIEDYISLLEKQITEVFDEPLKCNLDINC